MKIAFLGLGNMGLPMARHLLKAGHEVTVWNRTISKADGLRADGAKVCNSPAEAARNAEIAITMLADDLAVESAVLGAQGLTEGLPKAAVHISSSTISVALSQRLAREHAQREQKYIAAPVFGRPEAAEAGKLFVVAAGNLEVIERCRPVLEVVGQRLFVIGDKPEMANVVKLSGNFLISTVVEGLGEAIALTRKYGIDPHQYVDFLTSSLFAAPVYQNLRGHHCRRALLAPGIQAAPGTEGLQTRPCGRGVRRYGTADCQRCSRSHADRHQPWHGGAGLERHGQAGSGECGAEVVQRRSIIPLHGP